MLEELLQSPENYMLQAGGYELISELSFLRSILKYKKMKCIIYGAGKRGEYLLTCLKCEGINVEFFIDANINRHLTLFHGYTIYHYSHLPEAIKNETFLALISPYEYEVDASSICLPLICNGITEIMYPFATKYNLAPYRYEYLPHELDFSSYFRGHNTEILKVFNCLADEHSKGVYLQYIHAFLTMSVFKGNQGKTIDKYFECFKSYDNECLLNLGSNVGDTIFHFIENRNEVFEKIYAFESDEYFYKQLKRKLSILPESIRSKIETYNEFFDETTAEKFSKKKISLINMDIEGAEKNVIIGLKNCIIRNRPVLAVCAYHKPEDIIELPNTLLEIVPDYNIYFRKYISAFASRLQTSELVMYAVPKERIHIY